MSTKYFITSIYNPRLYSCYDKIMKSPNMLRIFKFLLLEIFLGSVSCSKEISYSITEINSGGSCTLYFSKPVNIVWITSSTNFFDMLNVYWKDESDSDKEREFENISVTIPKTPDN